MRQTHRGGSAKRHKPLSGVAVWPTAAQTQTDALGHGRAPFLWRPLPASIAGGAGARPDHSISRRDPWGLFWSLSGAKRTSPDRPGCLRMTHQRSESNSYCSSEAEFSLYQTVVLTVTRGKWTGLVSSTSLDRKSTRLNS